MFGQMPYMVPSVPNAGLLSNAGSLGNALGTARNGLSLLGKINWSTLLSGAGKTLNVVNQAIPLYYQIKPVFKNLKALGKIGKEFTKIGNEPVSKETTTKKEVIKEENTNYNEDNFIPTPTFFI